MSIATTIRYASIDELSLDPNNPRLGRERIRQCLSQRDLMEVMQDWSLEELAVSFLESGYWPQEAVITVREELYGERALVVVEGNRRLAALKCLRDALEDQPASRRWRDIAASCPEANPVDFGQIPYISADSRDEVVGFLGFRHVTGIKEWKPAEKAEYIAKLVEERSLTYEQVRRQIGSKTPTVRQQYIAYRLLLQLYLSLRSAGVRRYLSIDIRAEPEGARRPVPETHLQALANFALWLFGDDQRPPLISDSRRVDDFGEVLDNPEAVAYLERTETPSFEMAYRLAGAGEREVVRLVLAAADSIELALGRAHLFRESDDLRRAVDLCCRDAQELRRSVPPHPDSTAEAGQ